MAATAEEVEDPRLMPLFIGYPEFVRGYGVNSFEPGECNNAANCPTFDRLSGSRMLVGNVELRFPLLRPFGVSDRMYGPIPVEVAFFLDSGVAWNKGDKPSFLNGSRTAGLERRHHAAQQRARICHRPDRLRTAVRSLRARLGVGILSDAGILERAARQALGFGL